MEARTMLAHGEAPGESRKAADEAKRKEASDTFEKIAKEWHTAKLRSWQTEQPAQLVTDAMHDDAKVANTAGCLWQTRFMA